MYFQNETLREYVWTRSRKPVAHFLKIGLQMAFEHGEWHIYILFGKSHAEALTNQNLMQFLRSTCQH